MNLEGWCMVCIEVNIQGKVFFQATKIRGLELYESRICAGFVDGDSGMGGPWY